MGILRRRIKKISERIAGRYILPRIESGSYEIAALRRLFDYLQVDCVFDVGANRGQYARRLREGVGFSGPIISFEPIPELAAEMRRSASHDPAWHVEASALDREAGSTTFNIMEHDQFSSMLPPNRRQLSIFADGNRIARQVEVVRSTLRAELPRWQAMLCFRRPFLKLDTQGHDVAVVQGAGETIRDFVGLQSELAFQSLYEDSPSGFEALSVYRDLGFELNALIPNNEGYFPILAEMDCLMFRRDGSEQ